MRSTFFKTAVILALLIPSVSFADVRDIYYGDKGDDVKAVQQFLKDLGIFKGSVTGQYYTVTKKSVITFQKRYGIRPTGNVGPMTRAKMAELYTAQKVKQGGTSPIKVSSSPTDSSFDVNDMSVPKAKNTTTTKTVEDTPLSNPNFDVTSTPSGEVVSGVSTSSPQTGSSLPSVDSDQGIPTFDASLEDRS